VISKRELLEDNVDFYTNKFKNVDPIPVPEFWGGYNVDPIEIEFWQGRQSRLHDRLLYTKTDQNWKITRLAP
jgi:pyridoxamine 5'-phosphate oxidase